MSDGALADVKPNKPGICPWPSSVTTPSRLCSDDDDCQGSRKCCPTKAGNACVDPASRQLAGRRPSCPPAAYVMGIPGSCRKDKDCDDGKKCCDGNEGKSCSVTVLPR
ncbi:WAP domain containing protein, SLPI-like [Trichuris trichiura]|uniref:WAP domain containing protein, SLPI-like n=1 Tax=Trichuris trichiura TaxID=36087 RepID=A0A077ZKH8_TRITR|nr:WAP domain containing protein, SLPI-like [Trichuris trichiura]